MGASEKGKREGQEAKAATEVPLNRMRIQRFLERMTVSATATTKPAMLVVKDTYGAHVSSNCQREVTGRNHNADLLYSDYT